MKCGLDDAFAAGLTTNDLEALIVGTLPGAGPDWQEPIPFDDPTGPEFPLDALPTELAAYVRAVAEDTGAPIDLAAWCALATIGAATRGRYVVSPKPTWREPSHIQALQVVASGGGKSPAYSQITEPLTIWDNDQATAAKQKLSLWKVKGKTLAAAEKLAQREADKMNAGADAQRALEAIQLDIIKHAEEDKPVAQHIVVNDITPQAFWKFLHRQQGSGRPLPLRVNSFATSTGTVMRRSGNRSSRDSAGMGTTCDGPAMMMMTAGLYRVRLSQFRWPSNRRYWKTWGR